MFLSEENLFRKYGSNKKKPGENKENPSYEDSELPMIFYDGSSVREIESSEN